ncbi:MAG: hypothetical protein EOO38_10580 [Cytophagaceae bacterium]|nr:MAG: hypothetical protein EOO38_10580 [Cytophagaceae bacterium]
MVAVLSLGFISSPSSMSLIGLKAVSFGCLGIFGQGILPLLQLQLPEITKKINRKNNTEKPREPGAFLPFTGFSGCCFAAIIVKVTFSLRQFLR